MKNFKVFTVIISLVVILFSCEKDDKNDNNGITITKETISSKWIVGDNATYKSFEFNKSGNYIIVVDNMKKSTNEEDIVFGNYQIVDDITIKLENYGTIKITKMDDSNISFSLTLEASNGNEISINASKAEEMQSSSNTELLCRTWNMVSINGENVAGTEDELTVLFSQAGTYFVTYLNSTDEEDGGLAEWKWKDENQETLCYSWDGELTCDGDNEVQIEVATNSLKITEEFDGEFEIYILEPLIVAKSAKKSKKYSNTIRNKNSFFGLNKK